MCFPKNVHEGVQLTEAQKEFLKLLQKDSAGQDLNLDLTTKTGLQQFVYGCIATRVQAIWALEGASQKTVKQETLDNAESAYSVLKEIKTFVDVHEGLDELLIQASREFLGGFEEEYLAQRNRICPVVEKE